MAETSTATRTPTPARRRTPSASVRDGTARTSARRAPRRPSVHVPVLGSLAMPEPDRLAFYAVLGALGVLGVVEWPVVLVVGVGHILSDQHFSTALQQAGEAAEAA
ncbi:hypothetical protein Misp01_15570 [Microtetraspora sp. NBRC 13810]|uniref:hypothetical protein n=1 Tax=Microtetraspora sp. NBRC 13810 TaxID=3030990 RepID=UPI0024A0300D|nr:hypothetical protein [Microtetraspora sp. NBRC 13810]GLW06427.1 hypothetical protein Misp01_15570 [Microtetraspora sp. NBRC 13810]